MAWTQVGYLWIGRMQYHMIQLFVVPKSQEQNAHRQVLISTNTFIPINAMLKQKASTILSLIPSFLVLLFTLTLPFPFLLLLRLLLSLLLLLTVHPL